MPDTTDIVETFSPVHPGAILREEFIEPLDLTAGRVAKACGIARTRIERLVAEDIGISGDTALRLARFFKTTPQFWMNLQQHYEIEKAAEALGPAVDRIVPFVRAASLFLSSRLTPAPPARPHPPAASRRHSRTPAPRD